MTTVRIFLNSARHSFDGYQADHAVVEVASYVTTSTDEEFVLAEAFRLFNVGDDPASGPPDPRAVQYRSRRNRSLSVGDIVAVDGVFHACTRSGWNRLSTTPVVTCEPGPGTTPLRSALPDHALLQLRFGYNGGLPPGTTTAWGARAIIDRSGSVDVPHDRQFGDGPRIEELLDHLNGRVRGAWQDRAAELLRAGTIRTDVSADVLIYRDELATIRGNTQASGGYLYVCAYFHGAD